MIGAGTHTLTVVSQPREWESKFGPMKSYTVKVEGDDGSYEISRKASTQAPTVGQKIEVAEVTADPNGKYPPKLKMAYAGGGGGKGGKSPEEQARITRMAAQKAAIEWARLTHERGKLPDDFTIDNLTPIVDWFVADANGAKA